MDAETEARLSALLARPVAWDRLRARARRHGLVPLAHRHLGARSGVPNGVAEALREEYVAQARRSLRLAAELRRVLDALEEGGIHALAYKGPALAVLAYGDLSLRAFGDLDVLVRPGDAPRALALLAAQGFAPGYTLSPTRERFFRRVDGDFPLHRAADDTLLELHCRASSLRFGVALETAALAARARPVRVGGAEVPTLAADDLLLALCVHGAKHRWERLEWIAAVAELLRRDGADLPALLARASRAGARTMLALGLLLAHRLLGAPLPGSVLEIVLSHAAAARLAAETEAILFSEDSDGGEMAAEGDERAGTAAKLRYNLRAQDGAMRRAAFAARWLLHPTPEDWAAVSLPDPLFPLYRVVRPARLLLRYGLGRR
jgi:hypothetical protein